MRFGDSRQRPDCLGIALGIDDQPVDMAALFGYIAALLLGAGMQLINAGVKRFDIDLEHFHSPF